MASNRYPKQTHSFPAYFYCSSGSKSMVLIVFWSLNILI